MPDCTIPDPEPKEIGHPSGEEKWCQWWEKLPEDA
ncbi:hypothetical protein BH20ACT2_BH20ACT2_17200 [soil metagenome]